MQANKNNKFRKSVTIQNSLLILEFSGDYLIVCTCTYHDSSYLTSNAGSKPQHSLSAPNVHVLPKCVYVCSVTAVNKCWKIQFTYHHVNKFVYLCTHLGNIWTFGADKLCNHAVHYVGNKVVGYQLCTNVGHIACEIPHICPAFLRELCQWRDYELELVKPYQKFIT